MAKPKPISAVAVRSQDIIVRSRLRRVRIQLKWLSDVVLTSNRPALGAACESLMLVAFSLAPLDNDDEMALSKDPLPKL